MSEPEDLILEGAHLAVRLAGGAWRRYAPAPGVLALREVRLRLELFLTSLFGLDIPILPSSPPAPLNWLARRARRMAADDAVGDAWAGTDGARIYLPPTLERWGPGARIDTYLLLATLQAVRVVRGTARCAAGLARGEVRDRFLIAEAGAADHWVAVHAAGLLPTLVRMRRDDVPGRPGVASRLGMGRPTRTLDALVRGLLESDPRVQFEHLPIDGSTDDSLAWAATPGGSATYRAPMVPSYWGRCLPLAEGEAGAASPGIDYSWRPSPRQRVVEMRRRPRVREAEEGEDDQRPGAWLIRADDPQESVEDPLGLQRPTDRADDADPEGLGDALSDLPEARVVRTPGRAREVLVGGDEIPRMSKDARRAVASGLSYPEWDYQRGAYRLPGAIVRAGAARPGDPSWVAAALTRHHQLIGRVRTRFERLRPRRISVGRLVDGPQVDIAAYVNALADAHAAGITDDRLYIDTRPARRELAVCVLVDVSASTDGWVSGRRRIVDVEKEALLVVCHALEALGDPHALYAFSGEGAERVSLTTIKTFGERPGHAIRLRIAGLEPQDYTRLGAAIRHACAQAVQQPAERRLVLVLSDGKPNDVDEYEGRYGVEDARQAVAEARAQGLQLFCLTVDRTAPAYASRIFGTSGFTLLRQPEQLPEALIEVLRRLIRR